MLETIVVYTHNGTFSAVNKEDMYVICRGKNATEENHVKGIESISAMLNIMCFLSFMGVTFYTITDVILLMANNFGARSQS